MFYFTNDICTKIYYRCSSDVHSDVENDNASTSKKINEIDKAIQRDEEEMVDDVASIYSNVSNEVSEKLHRYEETIYLSSRNSFCYWY